MTTYDICLGSSPSTPAAAVLLTVTDEEAARRIVTTLDANREAFFQAEGLRPFYRASERASADAQEPGPSVAEAKDEAASDELDGPFGDLQPGDEA